MAQLLNSILTVIKVFQKYAKENGKCTLLCKKELKQLLLAEFGDILWVRCIDSDPMKSSVSDSDTCIQSLIPVGLSGHNENCELVSHTDLRQRYILVF